MVKYKRQYERKFDKHTGFLCGRGFDDLDLYLLFEEIPMTVLRTVADELVNDGFCNKAEVSDGKITMIEWEMMFCSDKFLIDVIREVLKESNYELILK